METFKFYDGVVTTQFEFIIDGKPAEFEQSVVAHEYSLIDESVFHLGTCTHRFTSNRQSFVDSVMRQAMTRTTPTLRFRVGITSASGAHWRPWSEHLITSYVASPVGAGNDIGYRFQIQTVDLPTAWNRASKTVCRKGKISSIVAEIAAENGVNNTVIEETATEGVYHQSFEGDAEFIMHRLIRRAVNKKGLANYLFYWQDGALHFHTPDFQAQVYHVDYYVVGGELLVAADHSQKLYEAGISGVHMVRYDPYTGDAREITSDRAQALRYAPVAYPWNLPQGAYNLPYHSGANGDKECFAIAQSVYDLTRIGAFQTTFTLRKLSNLRPGSMVELNTSASPQASSFSSGLYLITASTMELSPGKAACNFILQRGETSRMPEAATTVRNVNENKLTSVLEAPGQPVSLAVVNSSSIREGVGKQTSDKTFAVVSDANRGPS